MLEATKVQPECDGCIDEDWAKDHAKDGGLGFHCDAICQHCGIWRRDNIDVRAHPED